MRFKSPNGSPIVGTYDTIQALARATEFSENGEPEYTGDTEVFWDTQETITRDDHIVYLDDDGDEWLFSDLVPDTDEEEE